MVYLALLISLILQKNVLSQIFLFFCVWLDTGKTKFYCNCCDSNIGIGVVINYSSCEAPTVLSLQFMVWALEIK